MNANLLFHAVVALGIGCWHASVIAQTQSAVAPDTSEVRLVADSAQKSEIDIRKTQVGVRAELHSESFDIVDSSGQPKRWYFYILYDPQSGYFWWCTSQSPTLSTFLRSQAENFWVIPSTGIVQVVQEWDIFSLFVSDAKRSSYEDARKYVIAQIKSQPPNKHEKTIAPQRRFTIEVGRFIGRGFFSPHGDAAPPPRSKILLLEFKADHWNIEIQSAITGEKAVLKLDADFKILGAERNGKVVFPKSSRESTPAR